MKPDWPEAQARLTSLWHGDSLDRPCISITAPSGRPVPWPAAPASHESRWLDAGYVLDCLRATLDSTWWGGEAVPSYLLMGGWAMSAGGRPRFEPDTIWFEPVPVDFGKPSPFVSRPDDPWVARFQALYWAAAEASDGSRFLLGQPCVLPANDLLSMHMGTERFLMALLDEPAWMKKALLGAADSLRRECRRLQAHAEQWTPYWYGNAGWMPFWAPEPYTAMQSDVSCMLSPELYAEFVLPELELLSRDHGAVWYHLDGGDARQHLPRLLSLPYLRVIQYTPAPGEPPNGPGHLEMYRRIQSAGKIVHIQAPRQNIEPLVRQLDRQFLMLDTHCDSATEGQELLESMRRWC